MSISYKTWCRLCGDLKSQQIEDSDLQELVNKIFEMKVESQLLVCENCKTKLSDFNSFILRTKDINEMFEGLREEDEDELCIRRLNAYRSHFKIPTMIDSEIENVTVLDVNDEVYDIIEENENCVEIDETNAIAEEILVEMAEDEVEIDSKMESTDDKKTFMYHMTATNQLLQLFSFKCHLCDQPPFPNMKILTEHCHVTHNMQPSVRCCSDDCGKMLQTWRRLMIHKERHFPSNEAMTCDICHSVFATKTGFESHKKIHERHLICSYCAKIFSEKKTLKFHEQTHQVPLEARKNFECSECHHKFITKQACQNHYSMKHEKVITVNCPVSECGKGFFTRKAMLEHQRTHRDKKFHCLKCNFMSKTKSQLNVHISKHCNERKRTWDEKNRSKTQLAGVETDKETFNCNKCMAKFAEKQGLKNHMELHNES